MGDQDSDKLLQQLHDTISNIEEVDDKGCEILEDLDQDIRALLERSGKTPALVHPSVFQRLDQAVDYFGASHPDLAALLEKVMSSLSNAGV